MRCRTLDASGDMQFGKGGENFLVDSPDVVAQVVGTRLRLLEGEWFVDLSAGVPYATDVLGAHTQATRSIAIRDTIAGTQGLNEILEFSSVMVERDFSVTAKIDTIYGVVAVQETL